MSATEGVALNDWGDMLATERDRRAWEAIRGWPSASTGGLVKEGIDFGHATRWFLWDKVGRAVRACLPCEASVPARRRRVASEGSVAQETKARLTSRLRSRVLRARLAAQRVARHRRVLYCPFPFSRHARILDALIECDRTYEIVVPDSFVASWPGTVGVTTSRPEAHADAGFAENLCAGMLSGLAQEGVTILEEDRSVLGAELQEYVAIVAAVKKDLARVRPDAVLVPSDNTPPFSALVHAARAADIPVIMLQHGLDCERYYLDDAYATHIASWGAYRRERYEKDSEFAPTQIYEIGNPFYDDPSLEALKGPGVQGRWLWVTRPHVSEKCYAPSRRQDEGLEIFDALADALVTCPETHLHIKCHAFDYADQYEELIRERGLEPRINVVTGAIMHLLGEAQVVISEDSTAGMDAMLLGKPLVHAHFAESEPVMPFAEGGAAVSAFSHEGLVEAMSIATQLSESDLKTMQDKQNAFLDYAAGPRDGNAGTRFCEFVAKVLA
jgi:hypothetical protein